MEANAMTTHLTDTQKQTIRKALAMFEGWTDINFYEDNAGPGFWNGYPPAKIGVDKNGDLTHEKARDHAQLPHYLTDLDACHAVEVKLTDDEHDRFRNWLSDTVLCVDSTPSQHRRDYASASAEHRALALYRSLNLGELGD